MHLRNSTSHFGAPGPKSPARRLRRLIEDFRVVPGKYQDNTSSEPTAGALYILTLSLFVNHYTICSSVILSY